MPDKRVSAEYWPKGDCTCISCVKNREISQLRAQLEAYQLLAQETGKALAERDAKLAAVKAKIERVGVQRVYNSAEVEAYRDVCAEWYAKPEIDIALSDTEAQ